LRLNTNGIVETALYVEDVRRSAGFYRELFAFKTLLEDDELCAFAVPGPAVLLLFKKGTRLEPFVTPGGAIPAHDASGRMHVSFKVPAEALADCRAELESRGIPIESRVDWPRGGISLYFRDPDQHLVELITPGVWENY
jgi:catechol 2,3-dioxygenase-like lactoylglutathione lyase family enzyme